MDIENYSLQDFRQLTVVKLKGILKAHEEPTSGNNDVLVAKCYALQTKIKSGTGSDQSASACSTSASIVSTNPFSVFDEFKELTYDVLNLSAKGRVWSNDLRTMVECNFHQVYDYLVLKTQKYEDSVMKGSCYKKLKSYKLYAEGHVSNIEVAKGLGYVWVKSKVIASMRKTKYRVMIIFSNSGDVRFAACECPAGLGIGGCGKCNHVGGLLFAVQTFFMNGLHTRPEKVSCTSKLNGWVVPRNLTIKPKPIKDINVSKIQFGSDTRRQRDNQNSLYDPRAPQHRSLNHFAQNILYEKLSECAPLSGFFLFHEKPESSGDGQIEFTDTVESVNVSENAIVETTASLSKNLHLCIEEKVENNVTEIPTIEVNLEISDDIDINAKFIDEYVSNIVENEVISKETIDNIERNTKLQSESELWQQLHRCKMTASNFGKIIKCSLNPNSLIKVMLYDSPTSKYLQYGKEHEQDAIDMYIKYTSDKNNNENVKVIKSGLILSEERPGYGASLDGFIIKSTSGEVVGGIECKCPASKCGMSVDEACEDSRFYLSKDDSGKISLKRNNNYYLQVQGQLFISKLDFVDFVVWFGPEENLFVERIYFDHAKWYNEHMPALDFFYKWVFIPEMLTRRVKRGLELHSVAEWKELKKNFIAFINIEEKK